MLKRIGTTDNIGDFITGVKEGKEKLMGFGHRVYKNYDPRAKIIKKGLRRRLRGDRCQPAQDRPGMETIALEDEYFVKRKLYPNVDFYSGLIYEALQFPAGDVHRLVRHRPYAGLARPMVGAGAGQGTEDRSAKTGLPAESRQGTSSPSASVDPLVICVYRGAPVSANCMRVPHACRATSPAHVL